jgi:hypothetical protein
MATIDKFLEMDGLLIQWIGLLIVKMFCQYLYDKV